MLFYYKEVKFILMQLLYEPLIYMFSFLTPEKNVVYIIKRYMVIFYENFVFLGSKLKMKLLIRMEVISSDYQFTIYISHKNDHGC